MDSNVMVSLIIYWITSPFRMGNIIVQYIDLRFIQSSNLPQAFVPDTIHLVYEVLTRTCYSICFIYEDFASLTFSIFLLITLLMTISFF